MTLRVLASVWGPAKPRQAAGQSGVLIGLWLQVGERKLGAGTQIGDLVQRCEEKVTSLISPVVS